MAEVSINTDETPVAQLMAEARREATVTAADGRRIHLVKPTPLAQFKLVRILGADADNMTLLAMYSPLLFVASIDGEAVTLPQSQLELDALVMRLDDSGLEVVMKGVNENFGGENVNEVRDTVKK